MRRRMGGEGGTKSWLVVEKQKEKMQVCTDQSSAASLESILSMVPTKGG